MKNDYIQSSADVAQPSVDAEKKIEFEWIRTEDGREIGNVVIDLSKYNVVMSNGFSLYYSKETDTFYVVVTLAEKIHFYVALIEFTFDNPEDFTVHEFSKEDFGGGEAFGFTYLIGETLYLGLYDVTAINIKTKEIHHCLEECKKATEYAEQLVGEWKYHEFWVDAAVDDVVVYRLGVAEGNDIPPYTHIYVAYRDKEFLGVLVIEYGDGGSKIIYEENPEHNSNDDTLSTASEIHISMNNIFFNNLEELMVGAPKWYDPELYDDVVWDKEDIIDYYRKDLTPAYIPNRMIITSGTRVVSDKDGNIVMDTVWIGLYHELNEDGSPKLTENVAARQGFSITVSKIGLLNDCIYLLPENEIRTSDINGTEVIFGYRSMPYGPYDAESHEPSGHYDMYVAEFEYDGIQYLIVSEQLEDEELVKVVSSIIYGEEVVIQ